MTGIRDMNETKRPPQTAPLQPIHDLANALPATLADEASRVMDEESSAIAECARRLNHAQFAGAVQLLAGCTGRVVVTGMGKSGTIARKLSERCPAQALRRCSCIRPKLSTAIWEY